MTDESTIKHATADGSTTARPLTAEEAQALGLPVPDAPGEAPSAAAVELGDWGRLLEAAEAFGEADPMMVNLLAQADHFDEPPPPPEAGEGKSAERARWEMLARDIKSRIEMHTKGSRAAGAAGAPPIVGPIVRDLVQDPTLQRVSVSSVAAPAVAGQGISVQHLGVMPQAQLNPGISVQHIGGSPADRKRVELAEQERAARRLASDSELGEDVRVAADALAEALQAELAQSADTGPVSVRQG